MRTITTVTKCDSCNVLYINGVKCHEHGCPDAWMDEARECKWCGCEFRPSEADQTCCDAECEISYYS